MLNGQSRFEDIELGPLGAPAPTASAGNLVSNSTAANGFQQTPVNLSPTSSNYNYSADLISIAEPGEARNGFLTFNSQSANSFNLAGAWLGSKKWVLAQYVNGVYQELVSLSDASISPNTEYHLEIKVIGSTVTLFANGEEKLSYDFGTDQSAGSLGVATSNAHSQFNNLTVAELPAADSVFSGALDDLLV
ncbi:MAG: hypothetical protein R3C11_13735 [Planctomycetaceae bacterium]